jgi:hypothetical protein
LREGELLSDSDPSRARCAYEDEPRQSTGGEQDPGPSHPANTKGSGHLGTGTSGSGGEQGREDLRDLYAAFYPAARNRSSDPFTPHAVVIVSS